MKRLLLILCVAALAPAVRGAHAEDSGGLDVVRRYVEREAASAATAAAGIPVRVAVTMGTLGSQSRLAPCARVEPFLVPGVRLWGRSHVGVHCIESLQSGDVGLQAGQQSGSQSNLLWTVQWPVTVRVFGQALLATRPLRALQPVAVATDVRAAELELSRSFEGVVTNPDQLQGRVPGRAIGAGQPIPLDQLRAVMAVGQGDSVKLVASGSGFSIVTDGVALNGASEGETVRVRTEAGRVLSGTARADRVIEVSF